MQVSSNYSDGSDCGIDIHKKLCVFTRSPFADCYCNKLTSANVPRVIKYCMADFESCPIFINMKMVKISSDGEKNGN